MSVTAFLKSRFPALATEENFSFAAHTTIGCGGVAEVAAFPADEEQAEALFSFLHREKIPHFVLGLGANVLASDGVFEGVLVRLKRLSALGMRDGRLFAGAGATGASLLAFALRSGVSGFEPFFGIPMTVGGATAMNAGVPSRHIADLVSEVVGVEGGKKRTFSLSDCRFSEKSSVFLRDIAVTEVRFCAAAGDRAEIGRAMRAFAARRAALPKGRSMGCTFVNPPGLSAGALIDACGLKGTRRGGAYVSAQHANFIINEGGSAADVAELIDCVRETVLTRTGVALREEIRRFVF